MSGSAGRACPPPRRRRRRPRAPARRRPTRRRHRRRRRGSSVRSVRRRGDAGAARCPSTARCRSTACSSPDHRTACTRNGTPIRFACNPERCSVSFRNVAPFRVTSASGRTPDVSNSSTPTGDQRAPRDPARAVTRPRPRGPDHRPDHGHGAARDRLRPRLRTVDDRRRPARRPLDGQRVRRRPADVPRLDAVRPDARRPALPDDLADPGRRPRAGHRRPRRRHRRRPRSRRTCRPGEPRGRRALVGRPVRRDAPRRPGDRVGRTARRGPHRPPRARRGPALHHRDSVEPT